MIAIIIVSISLPFLGGLFVVLMNPYFWQGLRNAKYLDKQFKKLRDQDKNNKEEVTKHE